MQNKKKHTLFIGGTLFLSFILFTLLVIKVDVQAIGPHHSTVGLATLNNTVFNFFKVNLIWYHITDWLGLSAVVVALGFSILGLIQFLKRRSVFKVDPDIILLGAVYIITILFYVFFEKYIINYRPILLDGILEPSYPSSHTMFVIIIMGTAVTQLQKRVHSLFIQRLTIVVCFIIIFLTIMGRLVSGVHWFSDIIGGILLSSSLCTLYHYFTLKD